MSLLVVPQNSSRELQHDLLEMLERNLRVVTPLEIDHIWSNNLGIE